MEHIVSEGIEHVAGTSSERLFRRSSSSFIARGGRVARQEEEKERTAARAEEPANVALKMLRSSVGRDGYEPVLVLRGPMKPSRGNRVKLLPTAPGFIFTFNFKLISVPDETANILECTIPGVQDVQLPRISVRGGSSQIVLTIQLGSTDVKMFGPEEGVELLTSCAIRIQYTRGTLTFDVGQIRAVEEVSLAIPLPSNLAVFVGSGSQEAANCWVDDVYYQTKLDDDLEGGDRKVKAFGLPPAEMRLLEKTKDIIIKNRQWARFDAFFGVFLLANSFLIGLEIEHNRDDNEVWVFIESVFIIIFTLELVLRIMLMPIRSFREYIQDLWIVFDTVVIIQSMVETWILPKQIPGYLSVLRLIRLMKLAKMVRLVRAFRELGMLVEGVMNSFHTLFWTFVLLAISTYSGALLLVRTAKIDVEFNTALERERLAELLGVPSAMWRLLSMSTFDQWATYTRGIAWGVSGTKGPVLAIELIILVGFVGIGILNMVAGILCHTAFVLHQKYKHMKGVELLLVQQQAMRSIWKSLSTWGERPLFQNDRYIGMDEFFDVLALNEVSLDREGTEVSDMVSDVAGTSAMMTPKEAVKLLQLSSEEVLSLCDTFAEDGQIEIDGLIEAIQIKELQAFYGLKSSDWIAAKTMITLRPIDMANFNCSLMSVEKHMASIERSITGVCSMAYDSLRHLHAQAKKADTLLRMEQADWKPPLQGTAEFTPAMIHVEDLVDACINRKLVSTEESRLFLPIDLVFGVLICANGIFVGVQLELDVEEGSAADVLYWFDVFFTVIFLIETIIRAILFAHLQGINHAGDREGKVSDISRKRLELILALRRRMRCFILPPCPPGGCLQVLRWFPRMMAELSTFLDLLLVVMSVVDSFILANLRRLKVMTADPSFLSVLRIFRLFRLAKTLRIFRVFPHLQMFIYSLQRVWKTVVWTLLLMILFIYSYCLYAHVMLAPVPELQELFGSLPLSFLTGWRITTFDHWAEVVRQTVRYAPESVIAIFVIAIVLGLGLMKMLIGVMSESAISLMQGREIEKKIEDLNAFIQEMGNLSSLLQEEFNTTILPQELIENALDINIRPKRSVLAGSEEGGAQKGRVVSFAMLQEGQTPKFANRLLHIFKHAKLSPDLVKQIYEKVDYRREGYVDIRSLALCAMVVKEDATKIQVFAAISAIRLVRELCTEIAASLQSVHQQMDSLLEDMCILITRKKYSTRGPEKSGAPSSLQLSTFGPEAMAALEELANISGTVPAVQSIGRLKVTNGHGQLKFDGDEATGIGGTRLRRDLRPGDTVIISMPVHGSGSDGQGADEMMAVGVLQHIGHERIKVSRKFPLQFANRLFSYMIVKQTADGQKATVAESELSDFTHNVHVQSEMSPRSAQLFFEWELSTKRRHDDKLKAAEEERINLTKEMVDLLRELEALANHDDAGQVFRSWRDHVKALSGARSSTRKSTRTSGTRRAASPR